MAGESHTSNSSQRRTKSKVTANNGKKRSKSGTPSVSNTIKTAVATCGDGSTTGAFSCYGSMVTSQLNDGQINHDHSSGCWPGCDHSCCSAGLYGTVIDSQGVDFSGIGSQFDGVDFDSATIDWSQEVEMTYKTS